MEALTLIFVLLLIIFCITRSFNVFYYHKAEDAILKEELRNLIERKKQFNSKRVAYLLVEIYETTNSKSIRRNVSDENREIKSLKSWICMLKVL